MLGPFANISPTPSSLGSSIFTSILSSGKPIEPGFVLSSDSAVSTGDVSVNPYPCIVFIPKLFKPSVVSLLIGAPP